ncbi:MAG: hypothetical protein AAGG81_06835 [Chlamydiota bacterium]
MRKMICGSLLLLLVSCSKPLSPWKVNKIETSNPSYNSSRYIFTDGNTRFELYKTAYETVGYFSVTSLPIPSLLENSSISQIRLTIDDDRETVIAHRITGGQKLILPENTLQKILEALKEKKSVTLETGRYSLTLTSPPEELSLYNCTNR